MTASAKRPLGVLGTGSWGTALAVHFSRADKEVLLWGRHPELVRELALRRRNELYLPGIELPRSLELTADLDRMVECDPLLVVVPSHGFRQVVRSLLERMPKGRPPAVLVSAAKGIESDTLARMSEVAFEEAVATDREVRFAVLAGPCFAAELVRGMPTASVLASQDGRLAEKLQHELSSPILRLYSSTDVVGVEIGSTSKNVIAVAAGVVSGLQLGHNTLAALLTRGLHEITRLGIACGGQSRTLAGLAGMGDLVLTCTGGLSRNRRLGLELAAGRSAEEITASTPMVAEGLRSSLAVARIAEQRGVEMPITEEVVRVLYEGKSPRQAVEDLMTRDLRSEAEL